MSRKRDYRKELSQLAAGGSFDKHLDKTIEELCELVAELAKWKHDPTPSRRKRIESEFAHVKVQMHILEGAFDAKTVSKEYKRKASTRIRQYARKRNQENY